MIFIGVALLLAVGMALLIGANGGGIFGLSQQQTGQLVPLLIILLLVAAGAFARRRKLRELLGGVLIWGALFGVASVGYVLRDDILGLAGRVFGELRPGVAIVDAERGTATFSRGMGGHFELQARVNGAEMALLFDTGASAVVLTAEDAERAGIDTSRLRFSVPVSTANGTGNAALVTLSTIEIGGIVRNRIRAFIAEAGALDTSLLGMTFLETLSRYSVARDNLELVD